MPMMIACRDIARLMLADAVAAQPLWKRMEIRLHLSMCRFCSRFARQIAQLGNAVRRHADEDFESPGLESRVLDRLNRE